MIKLLAGAALTCLILFELMSPVVLRAQLDGVAHDVADVASLELARTHNLDEAKAEAQKKAGRNSVVIEELKIIDAQNTIQVTVVKIAPSLVLHKWEKTKDWYVARETVTSNRKGI